jgi:hypothetical protein
MKIDGTIIDQMFQPIADFAERWSGKDCFFWAKFSIAAFLISNFLLEYINHGISHLVINVPLFGLIALWGHKQVNKVQAQTYKGMTSGTMNPARISTRATMRRLVWIAFFIVDMIRLAMSDNTAVFRALVHINFDGGILIASYLAACTPRGIGKGKLQELFGSLGRSVKAAETPV